MRKGSTKISKIRKLDGDFTLSLNIKMNASWTSSEKRILHETNLTNLTKIDFGEIFLMLEIKVLEGLVLYPFNFFNL